MYNLDVFEYEMNEPMALYGNIPMMLAHGLVDGQSTSSGIFWFNPSETFIDISDSNIRSDAASGTAPFYKTSHWISESGEVDFFMFGGSAPGEIMKQFTAIVGRQQLPPLFALGYHQCRWNYRDERDVAQVEGKFEELDFPMDVIWLDIDHTDGMRYFTWDKSHFPTPIEMQKKLSAHGRKLVSIVDPHLKRDNNYRIHQIATQKGYYVKNSEGKDFDGWCWPGSSSYLDFTSPAVREWWAEQFSLENYEGTTMDCFTWNDMNEPSVFNGPEVSMPKDAKNLDGVEHRHWHNLYGIYMQQATADGHVMRSPKGSDPTLKKRSFVLSRSFWAGSQRFGAIWTGDNAATWDQLKMASPMILSINLAGLSFSGSDAGGFFHEPTPELFTRWYQAASFTPFFRGHAHHDTKRREPWVYGEPHTTIHRNFAMLRYALLPLWYTAFYEAYSEGLPVMRTMFAEFPSDVDTFTLEDQWMIGDTLLVKPVTDAGHTQSDVYLPGPEAWYDLFTLKKVDASKSGTKSAVAAPIETMPVFIRAGKVVSRKMRLRRSASLMHYDPYTLTVVPDSAGKATGSLYMDDETSMAHETHNMFVYRELAFADNKLTCSAKTAADTSVSPSQEVSAASSAFKPVNTVERIELAEQSKAPKKVVVTHADGATEDLQFVYDGQRRVTTVKKPNTVVAQDWVIAFEF
jgi:alpha 1,3-glucosidase